MGILLLQVSHCQKSIVLFHLAVFELILGLFYLLLDVCEKQVLIKRVNLTNIAFAAIDAAGGELSSAGTEGFHQRGLRYCELRATFSQRILRLVYLRHLARLNVKQFLVVCDLLKNLFVLLFDPGVLSKHLFLVTDKMVVLVVQGVQFVLKFLQFALEDVCVV